MPLSTLNKVVSLVISGGFVLFLGIARWWACLATNFHSETGKLKDLAGFGAVGAVFILLPLVIFLGVVCDALTTLSVWPLVRTVSKSETWCKHLGCGRFYKHLSHWNTLFQRALAANQAYPVPKDDIDGQRGLAVGLALRSSAKEFDYALEHYAASLMASNFMVTLVAALIVTVVDLFFPGVVGTVRRWSVFVGAPLLLGLLLIYAIQKYCYAHEMAYRTAFLTLCAPAGSAPGDGNKISGLEITDTSRREPGGRATG